MKSFSLSKKFSLVRIFATFLVILGTPLEAYYYWYSFTQEGVANIVAYLAAATLILLLSVAVYLTEFKKTWWILSVAVATFSVVSTSAGQDFAFLDIRSQEAAIREEKEMAQKDKDLLEKEIVLLDEEYVSYNKQLAATIVSLKDRFEWKNTTASVEELKIKNRERRESVESKLHLARDKLLETHVGKSTGLYDYYASLLGNRIPAHWIQFIKHTILSIFLMLASPTGVKLWLSNQKYEKKQENIKEIPSLKEAEEKLPLHKAAQLLGISHTVLYNAWKKGRLEVEGSPARVRKSELERFMAEKKTYAIRKSLEEKELVKEPIKEESKKDPSYLWRGTENA